MKNFVLQCKYPFVIGLCCMAVCLCSCNRKLSLREIFEKVSEIERFEIEKYDSDRYGLPDSFGDATVYIHPNSSCRKEVLRLLSKLPKEWLAFEAIVNHQVDHFYMMPNSDADNLLFVHIGNGSGDTVLILFSKVNPMESKRFFSKLKEHRLSK